MSRSLQILDKNDSGFIVQTQDIFEVLDKIGDRKIAVLSVNGKYRTGKSFLLNYFLRYLKYHEKYGKDWINGGNETSLRGFEWRSGSKPQTIGIHMWSEPYTIKAKDGSEVALLLLDTQGNFDDQTTFQDIGVIFSFSLLMSSTLIMNLEKLLREDDLQFVEYFSIFAEAFSSEKNSGASLFQNLVFLLRDWQNEGEYPFGYYDDITPEKDNYKKDKINVNCNQVNEARNTREEIAKIFNNVSCFLMPNPGRKVGRTEFIGQNHYMEADFLENIELFVEKYLSPEMIDPKLFGGQALTGNTLKIYIKRWAQLIDEHRIPEAKTLAEASAEINHILTQKHALQTYENNMRSTIEQIKPSDDELFSKHNIYQKQSIKYFETEPKGKLKASKKEKMLEDLRYWLDKSYDTFRTHNTYRIDKELQETKMSVIICDLEQSKELSAKSDAELVELRNSIKTVTDEAERTRLENREQKLQAENDICQLKEDQLKIKLEIEQKSLTEKKEMVKKSAEQLEQKMSELRKEFAAKSTTITGGNELLNAFATALGTAIGKEMIKKIPTLLK